jgi:4-carboxymuconolactone decarboxylase
MAFFDVMLEQLFGEVWTRPALSLRDRRLITMGVIAALGERDTFAIQVRSALKNGELTPDQLREMLIHLAPYAGYPRTAGLVSEVEKMIAEHARASG